MKHHTHLFPATVKEVIAFSGCCMISRGKEVLSAENAEVVEIRSVAQGEGKGANTKDGPEEEIVAFLEADKFVELSPENW